MSDGQPLEYTGDTVDDAVAKGLSALGVSIGEVLVEVIEEPSRGILGIGAKPARVRLKLFRTPAPPPPPAPAPQPVAAPAQDYDDYNDEDDLATFDQARPFTDDELDDEGRLAKQVLQQLLEHMQVKATVSITRSEAAQGEKAPWLLNIEGAKVNHLIGRRGDTLASLQYITRLMTSRQLQRRANIVIDVEGYKQRRSQSLRELANRMADQAIRQARTVTLEPMPPHERRMIHMALRDRDDVYTKSTGEGDARKVMIVPK